MGPRKTADRRPRLLRDAIGEPGSSRRRALLISGQFPPSTSIGARRWAQMSHPLYAAGWDLDVVTFLPSGQEIVDSRTLESLPPGTRVLGVPLGPLPVVSRVLSLRDALFGLAARAGGGPASDTRSDEITRGASALSGALRRGIVPLDEAWRARGWARAVGRGIAAHWPGETYACAISSGPPHLAHLAARHEAKRRSIPLVVDLRDPWANPIDLPADQRSPWGLRIAARDERACVRDASLVIANNPVAWDALVRRHPLHVSRIVAIMNGSDHPVRPCSAPSRPFCVAFAGSLYHGRDPRTVFRAVRRAMDELGLQDEDVRIAFAGDATYDEQPLAHIATECGVGASFVHVGRLSASQTEDFLARAHVLVSLPQDSPLCLPAKLFEYTEFSAWVLVFADSGTASEVVFRHTDAGIAPERDIAGAATILADWIRRHRSGERPKALNFDGRFSRSAQAALLLEYLCGLVKSGPSGGDAPLAQSDSVGAPRLADAARRSPHHRAPRA